MYIPYLEKLLHRFFPEILGIRNQQNAIIVLVQFILTIANIMLAIFVGAAYINYKTILMKKMGFLAKRMISLLVMCSSILLSKCSVMYAFVKVFNILLWLS